MDSPNRSTPPATARPKNSSSSINSAHAASSSQQPSSTMAASSRTARGTTPAAGRSASKLADDKAAARPASRDSLKQKMLKKPDEAARPSKAEEVRTAAHPHNGPQATANTGQQLKTLRSDLDSLRSHCTCKICDRLLYQPYTISCGHTYCYTVSSVVCLARCTELISDSASARGSSTTRTARHAPTAASS
jgi:hypothetical protein